MGALPVKRKEARESEKGRRSGPEVVELVPPRIRRVSRIILRANNGVDPFKSPINFTKRASYCGRNGAA